MAAHLELDYFGTHRRSRLIRRLRGVQVALVADNELAMHHYAVQVHLVARYFTIATKKIVRNIMHTFSAVFVFFKSCNLVPYVFLFQMLTSVYFYR